MHASCSFVQAEEAPKEEAKADAAPEATKKEDRPKSPGLIQKLIATFKHTKSEAEKKVKAPKSPKKEKKKEIEPEVRVVISTVCLY